MGCARRGHLTTLLRLDILRIASRAIRSHSFRDPFQRRGKLIKINELSIALWASLHINSGWGSRGAMDNKHLGQVFVDFVAKLFQAEGFEIEVEPKGAMATVPDMLVRSRTGATAVVEIKLYRSRAMPISALSQAALVLEVSPARFPGEPRHHRYW